MKERKETISIAKANILAVALMVGAAIVGIPYYILVSNLLGYEVNWLGFWDAIKSDNLEWWQPFGVVVSFWLILIVGAVLHELVHGITWAYYSKGGWRSVSFGVIWKMLTPYCHCSEPLKKSQYITGALMPLFVVGILPLLVSPFVESICLCFFGIFYISGAAGDLMVVSRLRKENPSFTILDHPTEPGYLVYEEENSVCSDVGNA